MSKNKIKVLHFSSRYEECGVAKYLSHYVSGMVDSPKIENQYFDISPYETHGMSPSDLQQMAEQLEAELKDYDILHVQHEFALYAHDSFRRIVEASQRAGKKIIITVHIPPNMHGASKNVRLNGLGPHSIVGYLRELKNHRHFLRQYIEPFKMADLILVHNDATIDSLKHFGIKAENIKKTVHPVQIFDTPPNTHTISDQLHKQNGDVIFCVVGFLHPYKGINDAVRALKFLPDNYKLAIIGGMKADSDDISYYNDICNTIDTLGVSDRVYISGYVASDDKLNAFIRECDICVYPFDRVYYAQVSSGSLNLAFANNMPVIAYPTTSIKELSSIADGAIILCETFAYYELARELQRIHIAKQRTLSEAYARKMAWPKQAEGLVAIYESLIQE